MHFSYLSSFLFWLSVCRIVTSELARMRLSGGHIVTSSTLKWVPGTNGIPPHSISISEDDVNLVWCRVKQHGIFVGGALTSGVCTAPFLEQVVMATEGFEVLVSINGSARVKRVEWDKYNAPPKKSIASSEKPEQYLASHVDDNGFAIAGYLVPSERRVYLADGDHVRKEDVAQVLVEVEPESYDLRAILLDHKRTISSKEEKVMMELTLANNGSYAQKVSKTVDLGTKHLVYWGQVKGTLVGRKAFVIGPKPEQEEREIIWGVQNEFDRLYSHELEYELHAGSSTSVKIVGVIRKVEAPYFGTLTATYGDNARLSRIIEGFHMDERLLELKAVFSSPTFFNNGTTLPVEERVDILYKSTTTTTTTTTPTPSTTVSNPERPLVSMVRPQIPVEINAVDIEDEEAVEERAVRNMTDESRANVFLTLISLITVAACLQFIKVPS